jgi:hypothetical protein
MYKCTESSRPIQKGGSEGEEKNRPGGWDLE